MDIIDANPTCGNCHGTDASRCDACWRQTVTRLTEERDAAKADAAKFCAAWQREMREHGSTGAERDRMRQECKVALDTRLIAEAERDKSHAQLHRLEEENGRMRGELQSMRGHVQDAILLRDQALKTVDALTAERDAARSSAADWAHKRALMRQERDAAVAAADGWKEEAEKYQRLNHTVGMWLMDARAERDRARDAADEWAAKAREYADMLTHPFNGGTCSTQASVACRGQRPKQVGPANFVMRRCKLADGHDGMCEPA